MIRLFTSEHVSPGHPDKVLDSVAEAIVDYVFDHSKGKPRVAVDGLVKNKMYLAGEVTSSVKVPYTDIAKRVVKRIGYTKRISPKFNDEDLKVVTEFTTQSPDIAQGVDAVELEGAGDIGIMFGGAVNEAPDFTCWSHYLARYLSYHIYNSHFDWIRPDQKTQVTIQYEEDHAIGIDTIVVCVSHAADVALDQIKLAIKQYVDNLLKDIKFPEDFNYTDYKLEVNPTGIFTVYGPVADSGEVGRKIVCDQYGGYFPVGGGNLNGKDATKVDRSGVYMARKAAKDVVRAGMAEKCLIEVAYAIGQLEPVSIDVKCESMHVPFEKIYAFVHQHKFIPGEIIKEFNLNKKYGEGRTFHYEDLGMYGHIGQRFDTEVQLPWEE